MNSFPNASRLSVSVPIIMAAYKTRRSFDSAAMCSGLRLNGYDALGPLSISILIITSLASSSVSLFLIGGGGGADSVGDGVDAYDEYSFDIDACDEVLLDADAHAEMSLDESLIDKDFILAGLDVGGVSGGG